MVCWREQDARVLREVQVIGREIRRRAGRRSRSAQPVDPATALPRPCHKTGTTDTRAGRSKAGDMPRLARLPGELHSSRAPSAPPAANVAASSPVEGMA